MKIGSKNFCSALSSKNKNKDGRVVVAIDERRAVVQQGGLATTGRERLVLEELTGELCNFVFVFNCADSAVDGEFLDPDKLLFRVHRN